jgi:hypothetical protein
VEGRISKQDDGEWGVSTFGRGQVGRHVLAFWMGGIWKFDMALWEMGSIYIGEANVFLLCV